MARAPNYRSTSARSVHRREMLRESFIPIPIAFLVGGLVLAGITSYIDEQLHVDPENAPFFGETVENTRAVVSGVPGATLTFIGVVFSVALVALQLRSNQYSPRVLRGFIRARTSKITLGIYLATFAFSFLTLAGFDTKSPSGHSYVPVISVLVCELLVLASLGVFVLFVNSIIRSMRSAYIIDDITLETRRSIDHMFTGSASPSIEAPGLDEQPRSLVRSGRHGVIAAIDLRTLTEDCRRHDAVVRMLVAVGDYISDDETIAEVHGGDLPVAAVEDALVLFRERTLYQDPSYGFRQLVDIAIRALSPAVNDPTTAVQCLDRLTDLLMRAGRRHDPSGVVADGTGTARVVIDAQTFDVLCALAYDEIRRYGADSPQIPRRMFDAFTTLRNDLPPQRHAVVDQQAELLRQAVVAAWPDDHERNVVLVSDRRGLG